METPNTNQMKRNIETVSAFHGVTGIDPDYFYAIGLQGRPRFQGCFNSDIVRLLNEKGAKLQLVGSYIEGTLEFTLPGTEEPLLPETASANEIEQQKIRLENCKQKIEIVLT